MSARRLLSAYGPFASGFNKGRSGVTRLNSTVPQAGRSSLRVLVYGLGAGSLVVGGSLVYANYDPAFRNQVSDYVPAFGTASDYVADKWVELVDAVRPQSSSGNVGLGRKEVSTGVVTLPRPSPGTSMQKENPVKGKESVASAQEQPKPKARVIKIEPQQQDTAAPSPPKTTPPPPPPPPLVAPADAVSTTPPPEQGSPKDKGKVEVQEAALKEPVEDKQAKEEAVLKEPGALVEETKASEPLTDSSRAEIAPQEASGIIQAAKVKLEEEQAGSEKDEAVEVSCKKLQEHFEEFAAASGAVLEAQKALAKALLEHGKLLASVTDSPNDDNMAATSEAVSNSEKVVKNARESLGEALVSHKKSVGALQMELPKAFSLGLQSLVSELEIKMAVLGTEVLAATSLVAEAEASSNTVAQERASLREELQRELGAALPEAGSQSEALLLMFQKKVNSLKQKLEATVSKQEEDLTAALEKQKQCLEEDAEKRTKWLVQKKELELHQELKQKVDEVASSYEAELRENLMIQNDIHTNNLAKSLQTQADELGDMWERRLEEKLSEQAFGNQKSLSKALGKIRGIELMVDAVTNAGAETRRQQGLRTSCDAVNNSLELANAGAEPSDRFSITEEVASLRKAAKGDVFISTMLDSLPPSATTPTGIQSQSALTERFKQVKRIARRVALVPATGGGLETYALSLLQSMLTFDIVRRSKGSDPAKMDTFDILLEADVRLNRGDLEGAVYVLNHLEGESGCVAKDWLVEARLYLETKQAVTLIENYMAASNMCSAQ